MEMGCDIHLYMEQFVRGKWICLNPMSWNLERTDREISSLDIGRDYTLFGFLAQVRTEQPNGFEPKGFPNDASDVVQNKYREYGADAHTPSFLTLKELKEKLNETNMVKISGLMEKTQLVKLQKSIKEKKPNLDYLYHYCQGTTDKSYVRFEVELPTSLMFKHFRDTILPMMERESWDLGGEQKELNTRLVFWFDN